MQGAEHRKLQRTWPLRFETSGSKLEKKQLSDLETKS
jgi:hypothetical protein